MATFERLVHWLCQISLPSNRHVLSLMPLKHTSECDVLSQSLGFGDRYTGDVTNTSWSLSSVWPYTSHISFLSLNSLISFGVFGVNEMSVKATTQFLKPKTQESSLTPSFPHCHHLPVQSIACWFYIKNITFIHIQLSFSTATSPIQAVIRSCPDCCLALFLLSCPSLVHSPPTSQIQLLQMQSRSCHFLC